MCIVKRYLNIITLVHFFLAFRALSYFFRQSQNSLNNPRCSPRKRPTRRRPGAQASTAQPEPEPEPEPEPDEGHESDGEGSSEPEDETMMSGDEEPEGEPEEDAS